MKLTKRLLSMLLVLCMVFSVLPAMGLPASAATATVAEGDFVIAVQIGDIYYALPNNPSNWQTTITGEEIAVNSDGTVTAENASGYTWTLKASTNKTGYYNIYFVSGTTTKYLSRNGTSTSNVNLNASTTLGTNGQSDWLFTLSDSDTTYLVASGTSNVMYLSANSSHVFGSYNKTNATGSSYYRIQLLPIGSGTTTTATLTGITLDINNVQTTFTVGDTFNSNGLKVTAIYDDESEQTVEGYSVTAPDMMTAGTKTVTVSYTENGYTKTADYTITVNEPTTYTVTYHSAGGTTSTASVVEGNSIGTLPEVTAPDGWTFAGWSTTEILTAQDNEPALYKGTEPVTNNLDLYAVYSKLSEDGGPSEPLQEYTAGDTGDYVIAALCNGNYYALPNNPTVDNGKITGVEITTATTSGGIVYVPSTNASGYIWTIANATNGQTISDGSKYIYHSNGGASGTDLTYGTSTSYTWKIESETNGLTFKGMSGSSVNSRGMLFATSGTNSMKFGGYALSNEDNTGYERIVVLPVEASGTMLYTTNPGTMYTITWMANGKVYATNTLAANSAVTAPAVDPTMDDTASNYFDFDGWSTVEGDDQYITTDYGTADGPKTYYAIFKTHTFATVNWVVDGATVITETYRVGETPNYTGETPTKESDDTYKYTFSGWEPEITAVSKEGVTIDYTAVFDKTEITYVASLNIGSSTMKVKKSRTATASLTRDGDAIADFKPVYSSSNQTVATIDPSSGVINAIDVGTTDITVTYTVGEKEYTDTKTLTVVESTSTGGYTLITQDNAPTNWSGEYIFIGRKSGYLCDLNNLMILTPNWDFEGNGTLVVEDGGYDGGIGNAANNASFLDFGFTYTNSSNVGLGSDVIATDTEYTASIGSAYTSEDTLTMISTGDNDAGNYPVLDVITSIDDGYAFEIELVDYVNMYYTIRVKGTDYYLANEATSETGNNGMQYALTIVEGDTKPLWTIEMWSGNHMNSAVEYTPPVVKITSVYSSNRSIYFNPNGWDAVDVTPTSNNSVETSRFRVYGSGSATAVKIGAEDYGGGASYSLYLYGNPNPFNAQISYNGDRVTLTNHAEVQMGISTITLDGALTPDVATEPNWSLVSGPTWNIVSTTTSGNMTIDANTGAMTFNNVSANDYAIVELSYVVHDDINNVNHTVSAQGMVVIIPTSDTYTGIVFERASGKENEVSYEVNQNTTELPLDFYVKSDRDLTTVYNDGRTSTGTYAIDTTNMSWGVVISSGGDGAKASISNDGDGSATLSMIGFAEDAILTVTVSGVKANGNIVPSFTYMVYVKYVAPTLTADSLVIDFSLPVKFDPRANDTGHEEETVTGIGTTTTVGTATSITIEGAGTAALDGNEITFTPTAILSKPVIFYYYIGDLAGMIRVIPATNVYYEDSFGGDVFTFAPETAWTTAGETINNALQNADFVGTENNNVYGYDAAYDACAQYSMGSAHIATVGETTNRATVQFSFYGTGFDVISLTGGNSGCLLVDVYSGTATEGTDVKPVKAYFVDTYYGYDSDGNVISDSTDFYQIPVMKIDGLEYGQYTAVITAYYHPLLNHAKDDSYQFVFDAVRIYDPCGSNATANEAYQSDGEANAHYISLRDALAAGVEPEPTTYTATFVVPEGVTVPSNQTGVTTATMPTADAPDSKYTFVGWVGQQVDNADSKPENVYAPGSEVPLTADTTFYALYSYTKTTGGGTAEPFALGRSGTYVIAANVGGTYYAMQNAFEKMINGAAITVTDGAVSVADAGSYQVDITYTGDKYTISYGAKYLTYANNKNDKTDLGTSDTAYNWTIEGGTNGTWRVNSEITGRALVFRSVDSNKEYYRFAGYATSNVAPDSTQYYDVEILPIAGGSTVTYYTTELGTASDGSSTDEQLTYSKTSNSGTRGVTCTTLDGTGAESYYTGDYTYANLSSQKGDTLLKSLRTLMTEKHKTKTGYDDCRDRAYNTDCQNENGKATLLYTSYEATSDNWISGSIGWNREHVWPQSLGGFDEKNVPGGDLHHVRPSDNKVNGNRGNLKYGVVGTSGQDSTSSIDGSIGGYYNATYFEPLDNVKGDVARICLYIYARYGSEFEKCNNITNVFENVDVLLEWCELDPVDTWEMGRNVVVANIQGNRNVFIDYPELAWLIFGKQVPSGMTTPSANAASTTSADSTASAAASVPYELTAKAAGTPVNSNVVFIDGNGAATLEEYLKNGPANEVYLAPGQAIAFNVSFEATPASIQLGMKTIAGGTANVNVTCGGSKDFSIATATEMYYDITDCITLSSNTTTAPIVITNNSSDVGALLSVTNLKWTTADSTAAGAKTAVFMTPESAQEALRVVDSVLGNTSEPKEPIDPADPIDPDDPDVPVEPAIKPEQFKDLDKNAWYYDGVVYAIENGLMNGVALDAFAPEGTLTRAMLVTVLYRQAGSPTVEKNAEIPFTDVARGLWYTDAIIWANQEGIALGNSATTFAPDDPVTREQMVTFLWRFAGKKDSGQTLATFADANTVADYAELPMKWAVENGIINGDNGKLLPQDTATRAQIANIFMRYENSLALSE